jgi:hypothetical protein
MMKAAFQTPGAFLNETREDIKNNPCSGRVKAGG